MKLLHGQPLGLKDDRYQRCERIGDVEIFWYDTSFFTGVKIVRYGVGTIAIRWIQLTECEYVGFIITHLVDRAMDAMPYAKAVPA